VKPQEIDDRAPRLDRLLTLIPVHASRRARSANQLSHNPTGGGEVLTVATRSDHKQVTMKIQEPNKIPLRKRPAGAPLGLMIPMILASATPRGAAAYSATTGTRPNSGG